MNAVFKSWFGDTAERVISTYVETLLGLILLDQTSALSMGAVKAAAVAAVPAAIGVLKAALASRTNSPATASLVKTA